MADQYKKDNQKLAAKNKNLTAKYKESKRENIALEAELTAKTAVMEVLNKNFEKMSNQIKSLLKEVENNKKVISFIFLVFYFSNL